MSGLTDFFKKFSGANGETPPLEFRHSEVESTGKYKRKVLLHAHHAETGDKMGTLSYYPPKKQGGKMAVDFLNVHPRHQRKGIGSALVDQMQHRHPGSEIDHGNRTPQGAAWWDSYGAQADSAGRTDTPAAPPAPDNPDTPDDGNSTTAAYQHDHDWLPEGKYWGKNSEQNDQRLFDGDKLRPEVRDYFMDKVQWFMNDRQLLQWKRWTKVYFAGSEAAKWAPFNGDLDCLIGIDNEDFRKFNPEFNNLSNAEIANMITLSMGAQLNNPNQFIHMHDGTSVGPLDSTFYVNPDSYDIKAIHPYAAYDVTDNKWAVEPLQVPDDWSAQSMPESFWDVSEAEANLINIIGELPEVERKRVAQQVYGMIHEGRKAAFKEGGKSMYDFNNIVEKYLDQRPDHPLAKLLAMKNAIVDETKPAWRPPQPDLIKQAIAEADKGVMIAFVPPLDIRQEMSQYGGEGVSDMHVTLAYMGKLDELTPKQRRYLPGLVRNWSVAQQTLHANFNGVGTFSNPGQHALLALPDIPHATKLRESLVDYLEAHGYPVYHNHGWSPHMTLAYSKHHYRFVPKASHLSWPIDSVSVFIAGRETVIPFGSREK